MAHGSRSPPAGAEIRNPSMLPGFRFLFAAILLSTSILVFGLGAAALLRASHEQYVSNPSWRNGPQEQMFAQAPEPAQPVPPKRPAHYLWAVLMARIYEVFPLLCPICGGQMHIIAFITHSADIRQILEHIGVETEPPHITPARGPPLWDECDAQAAEGVEPAPDWDEATQPAPDFEVDQRVSW